MGSPPLTRGKERNVPAQRHRRRITPAYAGKRGCRGCNPLRQWDHPRLRGEKADSPADKRKRPRSPPLTRGKAMRLCLWMNRLGITPAYAGKRHVGERSIQTGQDHPRLRGEKAKHSCKTQPYHMLLSGFLLHFIRYSTASFQLFV